MNRIENLIKELCPNGVEYKKLSDVAIVTAGNSAPQDGKFFINGKYPFCRTSDVGKAKKSVDFSNISDYLNEKGIKGLKLFPAGSILIPKSGASTLLNNRVRLAVDSYVVSHLAVVIPNDKLINSRFLYYSLESFDMATLVNDKSYPTVKSSTIAHSIQVPLPPRAIQDEIVKILDNFTELTTELTTELKYRKQQYEYYRDKLLTFDDSKVKVEYKTLKELCSITTGKLDTKEKVEDGLYPFYTCNITPYKIDKFAFDDAAIIIAGSGSQLAHVHYYKGKFNANQRTYVLQGFKDINPLFLMHYLKTYLRDYVYKFTINSVIPNITLPILQGFSIPLPPLPVQNRIAEVLDNFEKICHDLKIGLPSEISLRQKQYEYYRDLLLSFNINDIERERERIIQD